MLKETKTEETIAFFVIFLSLVAFQLGGPGPPLATPMYPVEAKQSTRCGGPAWQKVLCFGVVGQV